ncbi:MAG: response regulator transcription factor [Anaerolineales bacterium]|nr:response regulator transcription factor [Anaerolineales bacterium]
MTPQPEAKIGVAIADDHEIVLRGLRMTIQGEADMTLLGEARSGRQAIALAARVHPQVLLLDLQMPDMDGLQAAAAIHAAQPDVAILVLTSFREDAHLYAALRTGVTGYLLKDISGDELVQAIRGAAQGQPQLHPEIARRLMERMPAPTDPFAELTPRERDVLLWLARGLSNKEIGLKLSLTEVTVKGYVSTVLSKLHVADRTQAALLAVRYGLISPDELPEI